MAGKSVLLPRLLGFLGESDSPRDRSPGNGSHFFRMAVISNQQSVSSISVVSTRGERSPKALLEIVTKSRGLCKQIFVPLSISLSLLLMIRKVLEKSYSVSLKEGNYDYIIDRCVQNFVISKCDAQTTFKLPLSGRKWPPL